MDVVPMGNVEYTEESSCRNQYQSSCQRAGR